MSSFFVMENEPRALAGPFETRREAENWLEHDDDGAFPCSVYDIARRDDRTASERELHELSEELEALAERWERTSLSVLSSGLSAQGTAISMARELRSILKGRLV